MSRQGQLLDLVAPGWKGLNLQRKGQLLTPEWCVEAQNAVIDESYRVACRGGYAVTTSTPITSSPNVNSIHEYVTADGTVEMIVGWSGGIGNSLTNPEGSDISGAVSDSTTFKFGNYNDKVIGFADGQKPIVYSGATFATITESSGTAPTVHNGIGLCAYGRVWACDSDGNTIKYSGLLDETDWGTVSAGLIDMSNIWPGGMDEVKAIAAFNGSLVVFGQNHIVIWDDQTGSQLGFNPLNMVVADVIEGTGCISHWSVQLVGDGDLLFANRNGVQSLGRLLIQKSNPLVDVSKNVRDALVTDFATITDHNDIRAIYSPEQGQYLLSIPTASRTWCFDIKKAYQDEAGDTLYPVTNWDLYAYALCVRRSGAILLGRAGEVWTYSPNSTTDDGSGIEFKMHTPWLDLGEQLANRVKILKRLQAIIYTPSSGTFTFKWAVDFQDSDTDSSQVTLGATTGAEFNIAEFNLDEFGGGLALNIINTPARARGQYFKLKFEVSSANAGLALQQYEIFAKIGRTA